MRFDQETQMHQQKIEQQKRLIEQQKAAKAQDIYGSPAMASL